MISFLSIFFSLQGKLDILVLPSRFFLFNFVVQLFHKLEKLVKLHPKKSKLILKLFTKNIKNDYMHVLHFCLKD